MANITNSRLAASSAGSSIPRGSLAFMDFTKNIYAVRGRKVSLASMMSNSRSSTAWGFDKNGVLNSAESGKSLILPARGLLSSSQRTNGIRNNTGAGGSAPSTLPTFWLSQNGNGITRTYAFGSTLGISYIDARFAGTVADGNGVDLRFEQQNIIAALNGQTWSGSVYAAMIAGSTTGISAIVTGFYVRNAAQSAVQQFLTSDIKTQLSSTPKRFSSTATITDANAAYVQPMFIIGMSSGATIDITLRIYLPQLEQGAYPSAPILTTNAAVQRNGDAAQLIDPTLFPISGSLYAEWEEVVGPVSVVRGIVAKRVDTNNVTQLYINSTNGGQINGLISGSAQFAFGSTNAVAAGNVYREALAYAANDFAGAFSTALDASIKTDASGSLLASDGSSFIGNINGASQPDGFIRKIITYPTRKADAELLAWAQAS